MSEFVKRTMIGYKDLAGGHSDPECTHVILTVEEYDDLLREISQAKQKAREERSKAADDQKESEKRLNSTIQQYKQAIEKWREALNEAQTEIAYQKGMNENLLRIARERANADRKLKPKKEHTGYLVVSSGEKEMSYKDGNGNLRRKVLWETVIQSPYSVDFTEQQARKQITEELLRKDENGLRMIDQIGIDGLYRKGYGSLLYDQEFCKEPEKFNIMLKPKFRENFRAGYWEAVFSIQSPWGLSQRICG